ncbi:MAG TPA: amidohydrolase family protein [Actinomycetota bacterium]|nr:amidohydrolase family protein [Actinomycetota bacterium]
MPHSSAPVPPPLAVVGVAVLDGSGGPPVPGQTVVAAGRVVERVGPVGEVAPPAAAVVVDGAGATLLPGFVDAHVHLGFYPAARVLAGGVTTVRDLGWPPERLAALSQAAAAPGAASPRLLAAGQILTAPGGYPTRAPWAPPGTARPVDGAAEAARAVAELAEAGAVVIKVALDDRVGPTLPAPVLAAVVGAAGERGLGVTAHVGTAAEAAKALATGVGELAHWPFDPAGLPDPLVDALAESVVAVPTLHIDPTPARRAGVRRFVARGGRVVYGTDLGNQGPPPGVDLQELRLLVEAGLRPGQALAAATSLAAAHLGLDGVGRVAPGARADLLLVDGDPMADLRALGRPRLVTRDGWVAANSGGSAPGAV